MIEPKQAVVSPAEHLALTVAGVLHKEGKEAAQRLLSKEAGERKMTFGECSAVASIAQAMVAGRRWKKGA